MHGTVEYSCQVLNGTNKTGKLKQNERGYYEMIVGALNMVNNKGEYYEYDYAKKFFDKTSDLVRMAEKGVLRGEYGHPKQGMLSDDKYVERLLTIEETLACCHHRRIYLDFDNYRDANGRPFIGIMSEVSPSGPYADALDRSIQNGEENVCFSIRCFSMPHRMRDRSIVKEMRHAVTFDYVNEPGIAQATKYNSPSLEGHGAKVFTQNTIARTARNVRNAVGSLESTNIGVQALISAMGFEVRDTPAAKRNFMELLRTPNL